MRVALRTDSSSPIKLSPQSAQALDNLSNELDLFIKTSIAALKKAFDELHEAIDQHRNADVDIAIEPCVKAWKQAESLMHAIDILTGRDANAVTCNQKSVKNRKQYADKIHFILDYKETCDMLAPEKGMRYRDTPMPVPAKATGYKEILNDLRWVITATIRNGVAEELKEKLQKIEGPRAPASKKWAGAGAILPQRGKRKERGGPTPPDRQ